MSEDPKKSVTVIDTNKIAWSEIPIPEIDHQLPVKVLHEDPETGMSILKMKYAAGFTNPWHTHHCGHGMYVLDGILETHKGSFGPGSFIWFPQGERMFHGATPDNDVTFLFIANKAFDISYERGEAAPGDA
jgi:quercetin dioxygenase-like cupin family protein